MNLTALSTRFTRIWTSRSRSARTASPGVTTRSRARSLLGGLALEHRRHPGDHVTQVEPHRRQRDAAALDVGELQQVVDEPVQPLGVRAGHLEEPPRVRVIVERAVQERLQVALDAGERRPELVGDVGHELAPDPLEPAELGHVVEYQEDAGRARPSPSGAPRAATTRLTGGPSSSSCRAGAARRPGPPPPGRAAPSGG